MRFEVDSHVSDPAAADQLEADLETLLASPARPDLPAEVHVTVVDDGEMIALHARHGDATTTDVMSFETDHHEGRVTEGEVVVCLDVARRQAAERGHDVRTELLLYAVHGLLHLCGYDDLDDESHAAMHAAEDDWLEAAGFGRPYASL